MFSYNLIYSGLTGFDSRWIPRVIFLFFSTYSIYALHKQIGVTFTIIAQHLYPIFNDWINSPDVVDIINQHHNELALCRQAARIKIINQLEKKRNSPDAALPIGTHCFIKVKSTNKQEPRFEGPFVVIGVDDRGNHNLQTLMGGKDGAIKKEKGVPLDRIKPVKYAGFHDLENTRTIVEISDEKGTEDETSYLVKFLGSKKSVWISENDILDHGVIEKYHKEIEKRIKAKNENKVVKMRKVRV